MDLLLSFFFLIISTVIGISIGLFLDMKSYLKIALISVIIFILLEFLYNEVIINNKNYKSTIENSNSIQNTNITNDADISKSTNILNNNITDYHPSKDDANNKFARQKDLEDTKYSIFKKKDSDGVEKDKLPLDGLSPKELLSSLNYLTYATSNPYKPLTYNDFKTHADKYLDEDGSNKLSTNDLKLQEFSKAHYPQLTKDQIDARDCLNYGSGRDSCFQSPQLFSNLKNNFSILGKGVNEDNSNLIIKEDFSNPMILNPNDRYQHILFKNAPTGNLDKILDGESNESIVLDNSSDMCRNCKIAVCKDDYCSLQNQLFL